MIEIVRISRRNPKAPPKRLVFLLVLFGPRQT